MYDLRRLMPSAEKVFPSTSGGGYEVRVVAHGKVIASNSSPLGEHSGPIASSAAGI